MHATFCGVTLTVALLLLQTYEDDHFCRQNLHREAPLRRGADIYMVSFFLQTLTIVVQHEFRSNCSEQEDRDTEPAGSG